MPLRGPHLCALQCRTRAHFLLRSTMLYGLLAAVRCELQNHSMPTNPGRLVYGTIAVGALLAAESARQETYVETVFAVAITLLLYWLAHSFFALFEPPPWA